MAVARRTLDGRRTRWHRAPHRLMKIGVAGQSKRELNVHRLSDFGRERLAEQFKVAVVHPVAKETVGGFDSRRSPLHPQKIQWSNPGLESYLAQRITYAVCSPLPQAFHFSPPQEVSEPSSKTRGPPYRIEQAVAKLRTSLS